MSDNDFTFPDRSRGEVSTLKKFDLSEQILNISKAHAYDIVVNQVAELKTVINELIEAADLDDFEFTDPIDTAKFKTILNRAKLLAL